jgi:tetratricopeptide (TPR) repeat protein
MKQAFILLILLLPILSSGDAYCQWTQADSAMHPLLIQGIHQVHIEAYHEALDTFEEMIGLFPNHPVGYFGAAAVYKTIMQNYRINYFESEMDSLLDLAVTKGRSAAKKDPLALFYLGGSYGYRGLHKFRKRDWWGAFQDGLKGWNNLNKSIEKDPLLFDAYYGIGAFHYWRGSMAKKMKWLPFFKEDQKRGIWELWQSVNKGTYSPIESKYALLAIYYDHEEYQKAWTLNDELYSSFPTNPSLLYTRGRLLEKKNHWKESMETFQNLLNHILQSEWPSMGYQVECLYRIAESARQLNLQNVALENLKKALGLIENRDPAIELEGPLEDFEEIKKYVYDLHTMLTKENGKKDKLGE